MGELQARCRALLQLCMGGRVGLKDIWSVSYDDQEYSPALSRGCAQNWLAPQPLQLPDRHTHAPHLAAASFTKQSHASHLDLPPPLAPAAAPLLMMQALLHICSTWGVDPREVVMVGDSVKDDIVCGNRAGSITVSHHRRLPACSCIPDLFVSLVGWLWWGWRLWFPSVQRC